MEWVLGDSWKTYFDSCVTTSLFEVRNCGLTICQSTERSTGDEDESQVSLLCQWARAYARGTGNR